MKVNIINKSKHPLPEYKTKLSAGMDIRANLSETIVLQPLERKLIPTGLFIELPEGYEAQMRPRSGLALNEGLGLLNSPGTIDADYRGEVGIIVVNLSNNVVSIKDGDRIAQMVINKVEQAELVEVKELTDTERGSGGFGHTGKNKFLPYKGVDLTVKRTLQSNRNEKEFYFSSGSFFGGKCFCRRKKREEVRKELDEKSKLEFDYSFMEGGEM